MTIIPVGDRILIKLDKKEEKKEKVLSSGIVIPSKAISDQEARQDMATVVAVGEGRILANGKLLKPRVKEGDRVIYNKYAGTQYIFGGETYLMLKECDIEAIIKN